MADDGSQENAIWPVPKFYFSIQFESQDGPVSFQEISGLDTESQVIEYRHGDSKQFSTINMPGLTKSGNVTMKRGIFVKDNNFWQWYNSIQMNTTKRETVIIKLLDESGSPTMTWTLANAWPTKITATDLESDANEVAVETLELAHEGLTIENS